MKLRRLLVTFAVLTMLALSLGLVAAQDATPEATVAPVPGSGLITGPADGEAQALTGAGATFPDPLYTAWFTDYAALTKVQINYQAIGSGGGIKGITDGTVDFGASDAPMSTQQLTDATKQCGGPVVHVAMTMGGVAVTYNIPELTSSNTALKFTPDTLSGVYLGTITTWNDPKLVADNPDLKDVAQPIAVIHRSDGSGTTNIFASYLKAVSPTWSTKVGAGTSVSWPTGIGQKGSAGVSGAIAGVPYSIGYVETGYAVQNQLPVAQIMNKNGTFAVPSTDSVSAAAAGVKLPPDLRIMIVNGAGDTTYPISGFTWILVCPVQKDAAKATALTRVLWWAIHDGQSYGPALNYAPLPEAAIKADEAQLLKIKVDGKPALPADLQAAITK